MHRAAHQLFDRPLVFEDALALAVIGLETEAELRRGRDWRGHAAPGLRAFIATRSRLAEDLLADAAGGGAGQYVVLGAGLDTYGYRHSQGRPPLSIFEVDHPATQAWKRARLKEAGLAIPSNVFHAPVDFEREPLDAGLRSAEFDFDKPTFVAWLGVTPYLSRDAVMTTLGFVASQLGKGSEIVFDYAEPADDSDPSHRARFDALSARVARAGEPFRTFFDPATLAREVKVLGFSDMQDWDAPALNARYFAGRSDGLRIAGRGHCLHARV
jgi:methyltransferase (TIGR00027 family)